MFDGKAFGEDIVGIVRGYMEREVAPLRAENESLRERVAALEARPAPEKGEPGDKGEDGVSPEPEAVAEALRPITESMVGSAVAKAVAELPPPERGEKGDPGADADMAEINAAVSAMVTAAVAAIPIPEDGKDGRGIKELLIDREGSLIATMDDGVMKNLGPIVGKDGAPGKDGRDGFSLEDFDACVLEDDRTIQLSFRSGDHEHIATLKWPTAIYRGVFKEGEEYERGDVVTWGGSQWHCDEPTSDKPGTDSWTLAVKKGRDGKNKE